MSEYWRLVNNGVVGSRDIFLGRKFVGTVTFSSDYAMRELESVLDLVNKTDKVKCPKCQSTRVIEDIFRGENEVVRRTCVNCGWMKFYGDDIESIKIGESKERVFGDDGIIR